MEYTLIVIHCLKYYNTYASNVPGLNNNTLEQFTRTCSADPSLFQAFKYDITANHNSYPGKFVLHVQFIAGVCLTFTYLHLAFNSDSNKFQLNTLFYLFPLF